MTKKDMLCADILSLENEIEMMKEQKLKGITAARKRLSSLKSRLKKMNKNITIHSLKSPHTW